VVQCDRPEFRVGTSMFAWITLAIATSLPWAVIRMASTGRKGGPAANEDVGKLPPFRVILLSARDGQPVLGA
jgi:hypothetical protein